MRRNVLTVTCGLALMVGASSPVLAQAKKSAAINYATPIAALRGYLAQMNSGDVASAYRMYADISHHISLQSWKSQGDPFKGTEPILAQAHVVQKNGVSTIYTVIREQHPMPHMGKEAIYLLSLIKQKGSWKMVYNNDSFGKQVSAVFQQLDKEQQQYALKQLKR